MDARRQWCEESQGHRRNLAGRAVDTPRFTLGQGLSACGRYLRTAHTARRPAGCRGGRGGRSRNRDRSSVLRAQATPEGTLANGPTPGDWVTLDFLHLSGKAHEKGHGLLPLEIPQGPGTLRTCQASRMESLQQQGNKWSALKYIYANQRHLVLRRPSAAQATSERRRRAGVPGPGRRNRAGAAGQRGSPVPHASCIPGSKKTKVPRGGPHPPGFQERTTGLLPVIYAARLMRTHAHTAFFLLHTPTFQASSKRQEGKTGVWVCPPPTPFGDNPAILGLVDGGQW